MPTGGPFPTENSLINDYFVLVVPYLENNAARLAIEAGNITTLNTLFDNSSGVPSDDGWSQIWVSYSDPAVVNKTFRDRLKARKKQMQDHLRVIYADIPNSKFIDTDRNTLNIHERDSTPTAIQPVDFSPVISFDKVDNGIQIVRFQNPETPDSNAMPPNQDCEVDRFVGEADLADNDVPFAHLEDTGNHLLQVDYEPEDKGKTAYYRARYETDTGKTGPWSDVQSEIIL